MSYKRRLKFQNPIPCSISPAKYLCIMKLLKTCVLLLAICALFLASCTTIDLYEKNVTIPGFKWKSSYKPSFTFVIKDTTAPYQLFFIIRHTEKYNYNNIWINLYSQPPGDTLHKAAFELQLATNEKWLATGMDDIYEHRIKLTDPQYFKAGVYHFSIEQIMREDPLENVMNVGLRVEKK
jgi:gliding motility-associated lipoprotein GldH